MTELSAHEFKIQYKMKAEDVFKLEACLNENVKREIYTVEPGKDIVKLVYGILADRFNYRVRVIWTLHNFVIHGRIDRVWLFDDEIELLEYRLAHGDDVAPNQN